MKHSDRTVLPELDTFRPNSQTNRCTLMLLKLSLAKKLAVTIVTLYCLFYFDSAFWKSRVKNASFSIDFKNSQQSSEFIVIPDLNICERKIAPIVVIVVISNSNNTEQREAIRSSWASPVNSKAVKDGRAAVFFIVSRPTTKESIRQVNDEIRKYNDVLLADLEETYDNLILKVYASIVFSTKFCSRASFHMKVDDDVVVHIDRLFHYLVDSTSTRSSLMCTVWYGARPIRNKNNKWYISKEQWTQDKFPKYCNGPMYLVGMNAARRILKSTKNVDSFKLEDVFFTGIAAESARVGHISWWKYIRTLNEELWWGVSDCDRRGEPVIFSVHSLNTTSAMKKGFEVIRNLRCANHTEIQRRRNEALRKPKPKPTVLPTVFTQEKHS